MKIDEIMKSRVVTATPHQSIGHAKELLQKHRINLVPVVGPEKEVLGVVSSQDLLGRRSDNTPISKVMTEKVYSIPKYENVEMAARMMRKHKIHHLMVIDEKKLVGVISSFDLLQLVEGKRFVMRNAATPTKHKGGKRSRAES